MPILRKIEVSHIHHSNFKHDANQEIGLSLKNPVMSADEKILSLQCVSTELIITVKGEIKFSSTAQNFFYPNCVRIKHLIRQGHRRSEDELHQGRGVL